MAWRQAFLSFCVFSCQIMPDRHKFDCAITNYHANANCKKTEDSATRMQKTADSQIAILKSEINKINTTAKANHLKKYFSSRPHRQTESPNFVPRAGQDHPIIELTITTT